VKTLFVSTALFVFAGTGTAQPPTAPAPREVPIHNLTFSYFGPEDTKNPKVEMSVKDGKIEVRWTMQNVPHSATASQAVVHNGVLTVFGTEKEPAVVIGSRPPLTQMMSAQRIDIVLADGKMKVSSNRDPKRAP